MRVRKIVTAPLRLIRKLVPNSRRQTTPLPTTAVEADAWECSDSKSGLQGLLSLSIAKFEKPAKKAPPPPLEECPICQDAVGIPNPENVVESWTSLHCGHRFGTVCIQTWLQESLERNDPHNPNPSCPICRELAKHPKCGHLICPQQDFEAQWQRYQLQLQYMNREITVHSQGRQRRRLQRRAGHPLRVSPTPPKRKADTVGECGTCAESAAHEERMRQLRERVPSRLARPEEGRVGIKSYLPSHIRIRSMGANEEPLSPVDLDEREGRVRSAFCEGISEMSRIPRSLTPAPSTVTARRMSL